MEARFEIVDIGCVFYRNSAVKSCLGLFILGLFVATPVVAQMDAGSLLNQNQRNRERLPERLPDEEKHDAVSQQTPRQLARVRLKSVRFTGEFKQVSESDLQALVADAIGRELDYAGLEGLVRRVTEFLRAKGWLLAEAYLPEQDVTEGEIEIAIRGGYLDGRNGRGKPFRIMVDEPLSLRIDRGQLADIAAELLPPGALLRTEDLERAVLLINDLPGISARARLVPGDDKGSSRVLIDAKEGPWVTGSIGVDSYGNPDSGSEQTNLSVQLNDPHAVGDQLAFSGTHAEGLDLGRLGYSVPVGSQGAKLAVSWTAMNYRILSSTGRAAGLEGRATTSGLSLSYPFLRTRMRNFYGFAAYTHKALTDDSIAGTLRDKRVDVLNAGLSGDSLDGVGGGGLVSWNANLAVGNLNLDNDASEAAADALAYRTQGYFSKVFYGISRLQRLPGAFSVYANIAGQVAGKNLDSSERFILGGPNGIRAYPVGEASGDSGWLANLELRYDLPAISALGRLQFVGFYDIGHITLHRATNGIATATLTGRNSYSLAGWGLGVSLAKTGSYQVRLSWAEKIGDNPGRSSTGLDADGSADKSRLWLQAMLWY